MSIGGQPLPQILSSVVGIGEAVGSLNERLTPE